MTDRTDHRAEAAEMLGDADVWAAQAGELSPEANERACLAHATVHALLAVHDALTAADRYAANEAKQREAAEPDPLDEDDHRDRVDADGTEWRRTIGGCWHPTIGNVQSRRRCHCDLAYVQSLGGPLAFAPDADGAPSVTAPVADDPAGDAVDGEEGERRYLNAQMGVASQGVEDDQ